MVCNQRRDRGNHLFGEGDIQQKRKGQTFGLAGRPILPPLVGLPNLPIKKTMRGVIGLLTVIILKSVSEKIIFQSNKFAACKVKDEEEVARLSIHLNIRSI